MCREEDNMEIDEESSSSFIMEQGSIGQSGEDVELENDLNELQMAGGKQLPQEQDSEPFSYVL